MTKKSKKGTTNVGPKFTCCLCDKTIHTDPMFGHNPYPLTEQTDYETMSPRCCDTCNRNKVIPTRLFSMMGR